MSAIWSGDAGQWSQLVPAGFPDEAALHSLVESAPELLPLSGAPEIVVVGREVALGGGKADLLAVEPAGRLVVIEVKLARNAEARRAVIAPVLAYAAFLHDLETEQLERDVLGPHLRQRGHHTLVDLIGDTDQKGAIDAVEFETTLTKNLSSGAFRLVLVLDQAPPELVRLVGYLEAIAGDLITIDLISVAAYEVNGSQVLVPQRIDPERRPSIERPTRPRDAATTYVSPGAEDFVAAVEDAPPQRRASLRRVCDWAVALEQDGLVRLITYHGKNGILTLLPYFPDEQVGLVTFWRDGGMKLWRSVFERRAPACIEPIEALIGRPIGDGSGAGTREPPPALLEMLASAYRDGAASRPQYPAP
jgi:hypothetical protein